MTVRAVHEFPDAPDRVWSAVVEPAMLGNLEVAAVEPGAPIRTGDGATGQVAAREPGRRLAFTWQEPAWPAASTVELLLAPTPRGCTVVVQHQGLPDAAAGWYRDFWAAEVSRWARMLPSRRS